MHVVELGGADIEWCSVGYRSNSYLLAINGSVKAYVGAAESPSAGIGLGGNTNVAASCV